MNTLDKLANPALSSYLGELPSTISESPANPWDSDSSTAQTIERMQAIAREESASPLVQRAVWESMGGAKSYGEVVSSIFKWIKVHVAFVEDEEILVERMGVGIDHELLITPSRLLSMPQPAGDCDDFSMLAASMLLAAGLPAWFVTVAADKEDPVRFSHVFVRTSIPEQGVVSFSIDASHGPFAGWETDKQFRRKEWFVGNGRRDGIAMPIQEMVYRGKGFGNINRTGLGQEDTQITFGTEYGYPTVSIPGGGASFDWGSILAPAVKTGLDIAAYQYGSAGGPKPGQYYQTPQGGVAYALPSGAAASAGFIPPFSLSSGSQSLLVWGLVGAAVLAGIVLLKR